MNKLGFGFLRLPKADAQNEQAIDWPLLYEMVDTFLSRGGTYFDTAYTYLDGASETALRRAVVERHPREAFQIADKLPSWHIKTPGTVRNTLRSSAPGVVWRGSMFTCCTG